MPGISLKAHYDGERIQLDEEFELPANTPLLVTVLASETDLDRDFWRAMSRRALSLAFGDDEPEYTLADVKR